MRSTAMRFPTLLRPALFLVIALSPAAAFAHPGHDGDHGGGLTWDFTADLLHRVSSPYHMAPAVIAGALVILLVQRLSRAKPKGLVRK